MFILTHFLVKFGRAKTFVWLAFLAGKWKNANLKVFCPLPSYMKWATSSSNVLVIRCLSVCLCQPRSDCHHLKCLVVTFGSEHISAKKIVSETEDLVDTTCNWWRMQTFIPHQKTIFTFPWTQRLCQHCNDNHVRPKFIAHHVMNHRSAFPNEYQAPCNLWVSAQGRSFDWAYTGKRSVVISYAHSSYQSKLYLLLFSRFRNLLSILVVTLRSILAWNKTAASMSREMLSSTRSADMNFRFHLAWHLAGKS